MVESHFMILFCSCHHWEEETSQKAQIPSWGKPLVLDEHLCRTPLLARSLHQTVRPSTPYLPSHPAPYLHPYSYSFCCQTI